MPNITANGEKGDVGGVGFTVIDQAEQPIPARQGINGNNANCNWVDDDCAQVGGPGGPGVQGGEGGPGGPGGHGGTIDLEVTSFSVAITLEAKGGPGGDGGKGGKGQDGGKGGRGGNGEDCELGRHGGSGGSGGNGGIGGPGGPGGNGGVIVVRTINVSDGNQPKLDASVGKGGRGGDPGGPGQPGAPGDDGTTTGVFSTSSDCEDMGPVPQWGASGITPTPASRGNGQGGNPGTTEFDQVQTL